MVKPDDIEVILFDLGGVLIELGGVEQMMGWSDGVLTTEDLWRRWLTSESVRRFETGAIEGSEFAAGVVREFGIAVTAAEFLRAFDGWPRALYPGARELLGQLSPHYRLASVSNTNARHWTRFTSDWQLPDAFHHNFPSHEVGKLKPDREYFEYVLDAVEAPPSRVLLLDDNLINVEGAAALGIHARRAVGIDGARQVLGELGLCREVS
jgi:putative hydrolase of the HAD superfamily